MSQLNCNENLLSHDAFLKLSREKGQYSKMQGTV